MVLYEYECPVCGKVIRSQYRHQFRVNVSQHLIKHYDFDSIEYQKALDRAGEVIVEYDVGDGDD